MKFGARYLWFQAASGSEDSRNGVYQFSQLETAHVVNGSPVAGTGNAYASFLLGAVDSASMSLVQPPDYHSQYLGLFVQDNWKISKKLTINYGLRWDVQPPLYEKNNMLSAMSPTTPNPGAGNFPGAYVFAQQQKVSNFVPTWYHGWAPRLGLAYAVTPTLVVRASAGIVLAPMDNGSSTIDATGYSGSKTVNSPNGGITPGMNWDQGWTNVIRPPSFDPSILNGGTANIISTNAGRSASTNMVQLDIQKSFARDYLINVGYLGQNSHHIPASLNLVNQVDPKYLSLGSLLNDSITDPAVVAAGFTAPYPGFTGTLAQALKPFPQYFAVNAVSDRSGNSSYNALLVKAEKRFSNGLQGLVSYTWSKSLTDTALNVFGRSGPQDSFNRKVEKALSLYDVPQTLVISFTYALPWGPGRPFLQHGFAGQLLGGWALSGILTYTGGLPVAISAPNTLPIGNGHLDANYLGGADLYRRRQCRHRERLNAGNRNAEPECFRFPGALHVRQYQHPAERPHSGLQVGERLAVQAPDFSRAVYVRAAARHVQRAQPQGPRRSGHRPDEPVVRTIYRFEHRPEELSARSEDYFLTWRVIPGVPQARAKLWCRKMLDLLSRFLTRTTQASPSSDSKT